MSVIGFYKMIDDIRANVFSFHPNSDSIPDLDKWRPFIILPDDYRPIQGKMTVYNFKTKKITFVSNSNKSITELVNEKRVYLNNKRKEMIYGKFEYEGNFYDCDPTAREDINDFVTSYQNIPTFEGSFWYTTGGLDRIFIPAEKSMEFQACAIELKANAYAKYNTLESQLSSIDTNPPPPNAEALIEDIKWED